MKIKRLTYLDRFWPFAPAAVSRDGKLVAFSTYDAIHVGQTDGSSDFAKISDEGPYLKPSFSPNGTEIVCADASDYHEGDNLYDISIINVSTGRKEQLTNTGDEIEPVFNGDGNTVFFISRDDDGNNICSIRRDGSDIKWLTHNNKRQHCSELALHPNGEWIFYQSSIGIKGNEHGKEIHKVRIDGEFEQRLTFTKGKILEFSLSPNGIDMVFTVHSEHRAPGSADVDISLMDIDGTNHRLVEQGTGLSRLGTVSPDGKWLAVSSSRDRFCWQIYLINILSGEVKRLTESSSCDSYPIFTPDGQGLVFLSTKDGKGDLYLLTDFF